jgi:hypothetical protein
MPNTSIEKPDRKKWRSDREYDKIGCETNSAARRGDQLRSRRLCIFARYIVVGDEHFLRLRGPHTPWRPCPAPKTFNLSRTIFKLRGI